MNVCRQFSSLWRVLWLVTSIGVVRDEHVIWWLWFTINGIDRCDVRCHSNQGRQLSFKHTVGNQRIETS